MHIQVVSVDMTDVKTIFHVLWLIESIHINKLMLVYNYIIRAFSLENYCVATNSIVNHLYASVKSMPIFN